MKEELPSSVSFCFDLQQVQVLPKVPIQDAFYAQQLSIYFFCITATNCKNPVFYSWMEHQAGRGATEISSAVLDFLKRTNFAPNVDTLRLFSDGCGGQNKNSFIIHMLMLWLHSFAPETIKKIEVIFPVRGHSYLPADRIFGRVEEILKRHAVIKTPEKYCELYKQVAEIIKLGTNWSLINIKKASVSLKKVIGISLSKRIIIKRGTVSKVVVKSESLYRTDDPAKKFQTLLKAKKRLDQIVLSEVRLGHEIKQKKIDSLKKLLVTLSGDKWYDTDPELRWMAEIFENLAVSHNEDQEYEDGEEACECAETDENNFI
ncbi:uncharacterized protein LOC126746832 [Anthonomus grandis grandis]|uniref:uncharacterized protein LOC126746832 n=1 Tax=Anthonomus grandis grandis TaxID=2921223 RepID=UPI0021654855|nr:uncharacterized protein LOC126746832 [Anthonomus grandis grandis]